MKNLGFEMDSIQGEKSCRVQKNFVVESQEFVTEFIKMYHNFPCLWKRSHKDYRNRSAKEAAYEVLTKKMKETDPACNKESVLKKINSLRTAFRRENKKMIQSKRGFKIGRRKKEWKTSLWYYDLMAFVADQYRNPEDDFYNESHSSLNQNLSHQWEGETSNSSSMIEYMEPEVDMVKIY